MNDEFIAAADALRNALAAGLEITGGSLEAEWSQSDRALIAAYDLARQTVVAEPVRRKL